MPARLPVTLRKTPGGFSIQCGPDDKATLYLYVQDDLKRVDTRHLFPADAEDVAKKVARALQQWWVMRNKHGG